MNFFDRKAEFGPETDILRPATDLFAQPPNKRSAYAPS